MLIVFGGLPGTGKTTLSKRISKKHKACYLRIDVIEQALRNSGRLQAEIYDAGYVAALAIADSNLPLGINVVVDAVNPVESVRNAWRNLAEKYKTIFVAVEIICSDVDEHKRRIESRKIDIPGLNATTWQQVIEREYEPWLSNHIVVDTYKFEINECLKKIDNSIRGVDIK